MNIYCNLCANKDRKETCRTCVSGILNMTTDGAEYVTPAVPPLDTDALKATINKLYVAGLTVSPYQKAMSRIKNVIFNDPATIVF